MFRGRKRKFPAYFVPSSSSDSDEDRVQRVDHLRRQLLLRERRQNVLQLAEQLQQEQQPRQHQMVHRDEPPPTPPPPSPPPPPPLHPPPTPPTPPLPPRRWYQEVDVHGERLALVHEGEDRAYRGDVQHHAEVVDRIDVQTNQEAGVDTGDDADRTDHGDEEDVIVIVVPDEGQDELEEEQEQDEQEEEEEEEDEDDDPYEHEQNLDNYDYESLLEIFSHKWVNAEIDHDVSKVAANEMWRLATFFLPKISKAREIEKTSRKLPQFSHIRRKLYKEKVPPVSLQIGFRNKETNETTVVTSSITPRKQFPPNKFEKLYEIASVKERIHNRIALMFNIILFLKLNNFKKYMRPDVLNIFNSPT